MAQPTDKCVWLYSSLSTGTTADNEDSEHSHEAIVDMYPRMTVLRELSQLASSRGCVSNNTEQYPTVVPALLRHYKEQPLAESAR